MNYKLYHGDCLVEMDKIPDKSVDLVLCDLPFGTTKCKWDEVIPLDKLWIQWHRVIKPNGTFVLFGAEPFSSFLRISNIKEYKYDWTWDKVTARGHLVAKKRPMQQTECISVFGGTRYYPQMTKRPPDKIETRMNREYKRTDIMGGTKSLGGEIKVYDEWYPKTILTYSNANADKNIHPTQKPVSLLEYLIRTYSLEEETVLDSTMGVGSTGVACVNTDRNFIGIELYPFLDRPIDSKTNPNYFFEAEKRIQLACSKPEQAELL